MTDHHSMFMIEAAGRTGWEVADTGYVGFPHFASTENEAARCVVAIADAGAETALRIWHAQTDAPLRDVTEDVMRRAAELWADTHAEDGYREGYVPSADDLLAPWGADMLIRARIAEIAEDADHVRTERALLGVGAWA